MSLLRTLRPGLENDLLIPQQRRLLLVLDRLVSVKAQLLAECRGDGDAHGQDEEERHDDEGEDPLQRDDFEEELMDSKG